MKTIRYSTVALQRLASIYAYTYEHFGQWQADRYSMLLREGVKSIAANEMLKPRRCSLDTDAAGSYDFCSRRVEHHRIIYRETTSEIEVLTIMFPGETWEKALASICTNQDLQG